MNPEYLPTDESGRRARIVEEAGEVLKILGKIGRFGMLSGHPVKCPQGNATELLDEIKDLRHALDDYVDNEVAPALEQERINKTWAAAANVEYARGRGPKPAHEIAGPPA